MRALWPWFLWLVFSSCAPTQPVPSKAEVPQANGAIEPAEPTSEGPSAFSEVPTGGGGAAALRHLPPGGALYASLRPAALLDVMLSELPPRLGGQLLRELGRQLGAPVSDGASLAALLGIDPARPIVLTVVPPADQAVKRHLSELAAADTKAKVEAVLGTPLDDATPTFTRVQIPLSSGDPSRTLRQLNKLDTIFGSSPARCPADPACEAFTTQPHAAVQASGKLTVAYLEGDLLTVDVARLPFGDLEAGALESFRDATGGPAGERCTAFDPQAVISLCVDADAAGDAGLAWGSEQALKALMSSRMTPREVAAVGLEEAGRPAELAAQKPRLLDDGTLTLKKGPSLAGSWEIAPDKLERLEEAFTAARCAKGSDGVIKKLLPALQRALGPATTTPKDEALRRLKHGGWAIWPVMLGRAWPLYLPHAIEGHPPRLTRGDTCVHVDEGRLYIQSSLPVMTLLR